MSTGACSPEQRADCPLLQCVGTDKHHTEYPANAYRTKVEKTFRNLPFNKLQIPRCVHNAIHASGYVPEKPTRDEMLSEIWNNDAENPPSRSMVERETQLLIGRSALGTPPEPNETVA